MSKDRIGIFGSSAGFSPELINKTQQLGESLAARDVIIITGACSGVPYMVAEAAYHAARTEIWGFSPVRNFAQQCETTPNDDNTIYKELVYIPHKGLFTEFPPRLNDLLDDINIARKYRNVLSTASCDAGIVVAGRYGTLNEFTNLFDMGRVIGVLTGTGGIADSLLRIHGENRKPSKATVIFESSPEMLVGLVMNELAQRKAAT